MRNTAVIQFNLPHTREGIIRLEKEKIINIRFWLGFTRGLVNGYNMCDDIIDDLYDYDDTFICEEKYYDEVYKHLAEFINIEDRWNMTIETYNYVHLFNLYINFWYRLFKKEDIELLICGYIPHGGEGCVAYWLAKAMNIDTICVLQLGGLDGKFLCCKNIELIGKEHVVYSDESFDEKIENKYQKKLYYMKNAHHIPPLINKKTLLGTWKTIWNCNTEEVKNKLQKYKKTWIKKIGEVIGYQFITAYLNEKFNLYIRNYNFSEFKANCNYVYFPLHLQPEMTTDVLGGIFEDQILAIERIAKIIPDDWIIYVKDNPKQSYFKRSEIFFRRLLSIKKVRLVGYQVNTYELTSNSKFVVTITGTAGWEAISGGKNVVVFGYAWYRSLPGVFEYSPELKLNDILDYNIKHDELEKAYNKFLKTLFAGVVANENMEKIDSKYDEVENNKKVFEALEKVIFHFNNKVM